MDTSHRDIDGDLPFAEAERIVGEANTLRVMLPILGFGLGWMMVFSLAAPVLLGAAASLDGFWKQNLWAPLAIWALLSGGSFAFMCVRVVRALKCRWLVSAREQYGGSRNVAIAARRAGFDWPDES